MKPRRPKIVINRNRRAKTRMKEGQSLYIRSSGGSVLIGHLAESMPASVKAAGLGGRIPTSSRPSEPRAASCGPKANHKMLQSDARTISVPPLHSFSTSPLYQLLQ